VWNSTGKLLAAAMDNMINIWQITGMLSAISTARVFLNVPVKWFILNLLETLLIYVLICENRCNNNHEFTHVIILVHRWAAL